MVSLNRILLIGSVLLACIPLLIHAVPQESRVNQKKIERERAKKQKKAVKDYEQAVRRHNNMQSKSTKASMKRTKKESKKLSPFAH